MAKIRGFVLTMDKEADPTSIMMRPLPEQVQCDEAAHLADYVFINCEKNEGLQKLYSFHTLESVLTKMESVEN